MTSVRNVVLVTASLVCLQGYIYKRGSDAHMQVTTARKTPHSMWGLCTAHFPSATVSSCSAEAVERMASGASE